MDVSMISPDIIDSIAFGPDILQLLQAEIQSRKVTYQQIAEKVHIATGTVGCWFSRGAIPGDKLFSVVSAVGGAKLWMQVLARIPGNVFNCQYLDATDNHPKPVMEDVMEVAEALLILIKDAQKVIRHKEAGYEFSSDDDNTLVMFEDSVADSIILCKMVLVRMEDYYGRSARIVMERQGQRMKERGYCSQGKEKSPVLAHRRLMS